MTSMHSSRPAGGRRDDGSLLTVEDLSVHFPSDLGTVRAVDKVSLSIQPGEIVGLVGESGCGKSTLGMSMLRMVATPGTIAGGRILFEGRDLIELSESEMRRLRGRAISLISQDALAVMNPVTTVGEQITEVVKGHVGGARSELRRLATQTLTSVGFPNPELSLRMYPHQFSGGMQQRVSIAQSLILGPRLVIADEPTTALDVTVQAQILGLLKQARTSLGTSIVFITHDLAVVAEVCDKIIVMYAGKLVESGSVRDIFRSPKHPYTKALLAGLLPLRGTPPAQLRALPGQIPRPEEWPSGCRFHPRCPLRTQLGDPEVCESREPNAEQRPGHWASCHFVGVDTMGRPTT
jgi:oligopeptide/dipeptide ABC transporter ATP-binding protein